MERLSFISGSSANEDEDDEDDEDEEEDPMAVLLPPPPLPPKPSILLSQQPRLTRAEAKREASPMIYMTSYRPHYEEIDLSTVRRKAKRERNRTTSAIVESLPPPPLITDIKNIRSSTSKSR